MTSHEQPRFVHSRPDLPAASGRKTFTFQPHGESRRIAVSGLPLRTLLTLGNGPLWCAFPVRLSEAVRRLRAMGIAIETRWFPMVRDDGTRSRRGAFFPRSTVTPIDAREVSE